MHPKRKYQYMVYVVSASPKDRAEKNRMRAKLRRLCEDKAKNGGPPRLQVPEWLHKEWKQRDHLEMAMELASVGYNKDMLVDVNLILAT